MFVSTIFVQALLATAAFAFPSSKERFDARAARRANGIRSSHPKITNETHPEYSSNWAGAVFNSAQVRDPMSSSGFYLLTSLLSGYLQGSDRHLHRPHPQGGLGVPW